MRKAWTDEERERAMMYGLCEKCREPRMSSTETVRDGKSTVLRSFMTCPNGHRAD